MRYGTDGTGYPEQVWYSHVHPDEVLAVVERHLVGDRLQRCSILSSTYICRVKCFSCHLPQLPISFIEGCELKWHINDFP